MNTYVKKLLGTAIVALGALAVVGATAAAPAPETSVQARDFDPNPGPRFPDCPPQDLFYPYC
jgi:hypothetical protein